MSKRLPALSAVTFGCMKLATLALLFLITWLAACGTSNEALKKSHAYAPIYLRDEDPDTRVVARLQRDVVAVAPYNLRYTLEVTAPAGTYVLAAKDYSGGRYFAVSDAARVTVRWKSLVPGVSHPATEQPAGGVFVDAQGKASIYWLWDERDPKLAPVDGLAVAIETEPDAERIALRQRRDDQARRAAEQRAAEAAAQADARRALLELESAVTVARDRSRVACAAPQCDRAFALAQSYLLSVSDMRIQVATPTLIETFGGTEAGKLSARLERVPTTGDRWDIVFTAFCKDDPAKPQRERCLRAYEGFAPHMQPALATAAPAALPNRK
jgi:hypothetical protein